MLGPRPVSAFRDSPLCCRQSPEGTPTAAGAGLECGLARFFGPRSMLEVWVKGKKKSFVSQNYVGGLDRADLSNGRFVPGDEKAKLLSLEGVG